jgi:hypothetical protein
LISGEGVARNTGSTSVYKLTDGKLTLMMTDGKVTGATAEGHYTVMVATGDAAPAVGKTQAWVVKDILPGQFTVDGKAVARRGGHPFRWCSKLASCAATACRMIGSGSSA